MSLPRMRPVGLPEQNLMQCLHCGMVMGQKLLLQVAHHNQCDGDDPTTASGVNVEQVDRPHGTDDVPVEAKGAALNAPAPLADSNFGEASA